jgi:hypothetical protein
MSELENLDRRSRLRFVRRVSLAPLCLCLVAGLHAARVATSSQTPWKGGGFGMFSTVESESARFLRVFAVTPEGDLPIVIPARWQKRAWELRAAPTSAAAKELAIKLAELPWQLDTDSPAGRPRLVAILPDGAPVEATGVWKVRVECWRLAFDRRAHKLHSHQLFEQSSRDWSLFPHASTDLRLPTP